MTRFLHPEARRATIHRNSLLSLQGLSFKCLLIGFLSFFHHSLLAQTKEVFVTGQATVSDNVTLQQAKNQALNMARSLAVEQAAGVSVNSAVLLQDSLIVAELINTFSFGYLIEEEILSWTGEWTKTNDIKKLGIPIVEISLRGRVSIPEKSFYRNYVLDANLDKKTFQDGEPVTLNLSAREDLFILVINYTSDNKIIPLYPNNVRNENILAKDSTVKLPGPRSEEFTITVHNYPGHVMDTEAFIIFGFQVDNNTSQISWLDIFPVGKEIEYAHFFKKILQLPVTWIAQKTLIYNVVSN